MAAAKDSPARDARADFPAGVPMERLSIEASGGLSRDLCMVGIWDKAVKRLRAECDSQA